MAILVPNYDLGQKIGEKIEIDAKNVKELLQQCHEQFGEPFDRIIKSVAIVVNGRSISCLQGKKTPLKEDDQVWLLFPSSGG